jgi:hypothetical protein
VVEARLADGAEVTVAAILAMLPTLAAHEHSPFEDLGPLGWALGLVCAAISVWVIWLSVRWTFRPGEEDPDHPKRSIFDEGEPFHEDKAFGRHARP